MMWEKNQLATDRKDFFINSSILITIMFSMGEIFIEVVVIAFVKGIL